ncbi:MAG: NHL repeat-containing protein [Thermomicrobiales bacterium]
MAERHDPLARALPRLDVPVAPRPEFAAALLEQLLGELTAPLAPAGSAAPQRLADAPPMSGLPPTLAPVPPIATRTASPRRLLAWAASLLLLLGGAAALWLLVQSGAPQRIEPAATTPLPVIIASPSPAASPAPSGEPVTELWRYTDPDDLRLGLGPGLNIAPDGSLWVADGAREGFQIISPDGALQEHWSSPGTGPGQFAFRRDPINAIGDVAFRPDGGFYVADTRNARVQQFAADRTFVREWGGFGRGEGQFADPFSILVGPDGAVYVGDDQRDDIQKFSPDGKLLLTFGGHGSGPGQFRGMGGTAFDTTGAIWAVDSEGDRLLVYSPQGRLLRAFGEPGSAPGQFNYPQAVAFDAAGRLYVADASNARVQIFAPDGAFLLSLTGAEDGGAAFTATQSVAIDADGRVYVLDYEPSRDVENIRAFAIDWSRVPPPANATPEATGVAP